MATATKNRKGNPVKDHHAEITDQILGLLEEGTVLWHQSWKSVVPTSLSTSKVYRGINYFILASETTVKGYSSNLWGTYDQWAKVCGYTLRVGQGRFSHWENAEGEKWTGLAGTKGTRITFWKRLVVPNKNAGQPGQKDTKVVPFLNTYHVFNADQITCATLPERYLGKVNPDVDPIEAAQDLLADYLSTGPSLGHGGDRAFYRSAEDHIQLPPRETFVNNEEYYSTLYHEATHSTGHSKRLNREGIAEGTFGAFGDPVYSFEELVAEMGAAILCGHVGIEQATIEASAAYLAHWIGVLKEDKKIILQAASQAQKAVDLILGTTFDNDEE